MATTNERGRRRTSGAGEETIGTGFGRELAWVPATELLLETPFPPREAGPALELLVSSVRLHGVISPLLVRRTRAGNLQVVCGFRRLLAAREAGEERVPVVIGDLQDTEAIRCFLAENACRRDVDLETRDAALRLLRDLQAKSQPAEIEPRDARLRLESGVDGVEIAGIERARFLAPEEVSLVAASSYAADASRGGVTSTARARSGDRFDSALKERWEDLVRRTEMLFALLRDERRIDGDEAVLITNDLVGLLAELGRPPRASEVFPALEVGTDWLSRHSLWVASLNAGFAPREQGSLDTRGFVLAGLLHDIGAVFLGDGYRADPDGFEVAERHLVRAHPRVGQALIAALGKDWAEIALAARDHHERIDGSGYPEGLRGGTLGALARTTAVTCHYASLVGVRPLRDSWSHERAARALRRGAAAGVFDRDIVSRLLSFPLAPRAIGALSRRTPARVVPRRSDARGSYPRGASLAPETV